MVATQQQIIGELRPKIAKDLLRRGFKVQAKARLLLSGGGVGHPKRVNTGLLRTSIQVRLMDTVGVQKVRVGTNRRYARWVHDGTGIYGPQRMPIKPTRAKALKFRAGYGGGKKTIYAKSVKGMKKNEFLKDALPAFKG